MVAEVCAQFARQAQPVGQAQTLAGPTGERNVYTLVPRERVACVAGSDADMLVQLAAVLAVGARAIWARQPGTAGLHARLPAAVQEQIALVDALWAADTHFDAVLHHGDATSLAIVAQRLAERVGPIVGVSSSPAGGTAVALERLVVERALSINTAAAGGNASLMTIG
jgi:RHH-type proline utilization regulon transcriptional repressor/proline dehydrogenase/delta 1-pyrroline-5-carboxylate dehydrogenase